MLYVYETVHETVYETFHETVYETVYATVHETVYETVHEIVYETVYETVHETVYGTVYECSPQDEDLKRVFLPPPQYGDVTYSHNKLDSPTFDHRHPIHNGSDTDSCRKSPWQYEGK